MIDKQIIIDEERMFECVWCKYDFKESDAHFILSENPNECVCNDCMTEWADDLLCDFKRKEEYTQQLDQLKAENEDLQKRFNGIYNFNKKILDQNYKLACREIHLKQTLTEIKEIAEAHKKDVSVWNPYRQLDKILQKISEVIE